MGPVTKCFLVFFLFKKVQTQLIGHIAYVSENRKQKQMIVTVTARRLFAEPDLRC